MEEVTIHKVIGTKEECLKTLLRSGDDSSVISEKETSNNSDKDYRKQIALVAFFILMSH